MGERVRERYGTKWIIQGDRSRLPTDRDTSSRKPRARTALYPDSFLLLLGAGWRASLLYQPSISQQRGLWTQSPQVPGCFDKKTHFIRIPADLGKIAVPGDRLSMTGTVWLEEDSFIKRRVEQRLRTHGTWARQSSHLHLSFILAFLSTCWTPLEKGKNQSAFWAEGKSHF